MEPIDWLTMLDYQQTMHHLMRKLLHQSSQCTLTASELEILSLLYLHPENNTPLELSRQSGAKKEAISRSLKQLFAKGFLEKTVNPLDERSYDLTLTQEGMEKLRENYGVILQPMYDLQRKMGEEFEILFLLMKQANEKLENKSLNQ